MRTYSSTSKYTTYDSEDDEDKSVVIDDNSWREETLRAAYSGMLSRAAMEHELDHLRGIRAVREKRLEETRRRAVLYNQAHDPSTIFLTLFLLFLLGSYNLGIDRNISNLVDFFLRGEFHACSLKEGLMCTLLKFVLLFLYPVLLGWLVWVVKLEKVWRDHQEWVVFAGMVVGFVAMVHYEVPKALGMKY